MKNGVSNAVTIVEGIDYKLEGMYDNIPLWLLTSNKAFREESIFMDHCLGRTDEEEIVQDLNICKQGRHFKSYLRGLSLIYSFRNPLNGNKPVATLVLKRKNCSLPFKIRAIKGPSNKSVEKIYWTACYQFVQDKNIQIHKDGVNIGLLDKRYNHH